VVYTFVAVGREESLLAGNADALARRSRRRRSGRDAIFDQYGPLHRFVAISRMCQTPALQRATGS
jgi:hypothetical protein